MGARRAAARLARRELRRRPVTTLLVALLVALPVAAMVVASVLVRSQPVPQEVRDRLAVGNGQASLTVVASDTADTVASVLAAAPDARIVPVTAAYGWLTAPTGDRIVGTVLSGDFEDPMIRDRYTVSEGRMPDAAGEVAISPAVADDWQASIGSTLTLPELGTSGEVVGIANTITKNRSQEIFTGSFPDLAPAASSTQLFIDEPGGLSPEALALLQGLSNGTGQLLLAAHVQPVAGVAYVVSTQPLDPRSVTELYVVAVWGGGALTLAIMAIVMSSAFAIGARRQLRTLGLLAANGAPPAVVRATVVWEGLWTGVVGTTGGLALGGALLVAFVGRHAVPSYDPVAGLVWAPRDLVPIIALGVVVPAMAAALPARSAARISVLRALAGRRPLRPVRARQAAVSLGTAAVGIALLAGATVGQEQAPWRQNLWIVVGVIGGGAVLAGAVVASPFVVGLTGSLARRCRGTTGLTLRSIGRQRSRFGSVVAGIAAAATLCLVISAGIRSSDITNAQRRGPQATDVVKVDAWGSIPVRAQPLVTPTLSMGGVSAGTPYGPVTADQHAAIAEVLPEATRVDTPVAGVSSSEPLPGDDPRATYLTASAPMAAPASEALLDAFDAPEPVRAAIERGESVALGAPADLDQVVLFGRLANPFPPVAAGAAIGSVREPIAVTPFPDLVAWGGLPTILLPPAEAERIGLSVAPAWDALTLYVNPTPLTGDQTTALADLRTASQGASSGDFRLADQPPAAPVDDPQLPMTLPDVRPPASQDAAVIWLAGIAFVFTALVVALGLALAARDTRDEREVLEAVGAPPRMLRRLAGGRAALLAALGGLVAVPTALVPTWVVMRASVPASPFAVPWGSVAVLLVAIPAAIGVLATFGSAVASRWRPVTGTRFATD